MGSEESTPENSFVLEILGESGQKVQEILVSGFLKIGRGSNDFKPNVLIPPECGSASRDHAGLDLRGPHPVLEDRSRYGTIVNGVLHVHESMELSDGDEIIFGGFEDGWRVRFRILDQQEVTKFPDPLEMLVVSDNPRLVLIGTNPVEEKLGRDAFNLVKFLSENRGRWYPTDRLVDLLWPDPERMPIAPNQALARGKKKVNDLLKPHLGGQDAITAWPHRGYCMKPRLDPPGKN